MRSADAVTVVLCTDGVFPYAMGGMQRHSRLLAEHLALIPGLRLTVIHPHAERVFSEALGINEVRIAPLDASKNYLRELWRYSARVAAQLDALAPDCILSQGFCVWQGIGRFGERMAVMPHGLEMFQGLTTRDKLIAVPFRLLLGFVGRRSARVVSLGGKLTPLLQQITSGSRTRVVVIPNAVEMSGPSAYPEEESGFRFLFVGRFAFNKGIDLLMRLARELSREKPGIRFLLAGDGPERAAIEKAGITANTTILGKVSDAELEALYADCHALILPTRFEGMPTVVLEAMVRARPVIVSDVGAAAELVDSANGYLIPPGDPEALRQAVLNLTELSRSERMAMGFRGRERAEGNFSWPVVAQRFAELIRELVQSNGNSSTGR